MSHTGITYNWARCRPKNAVALERMQSVLLPRNLAQMVRLLDLQVEAYYMR